MVLEKLDGSVRKSMEENVRKKQESEEMERQKKMADKRKKIEREQELEEKRKRRKEIVIPNIAELMTDTLYDREIQEYIIKSRPSKYCGLIIKPESGKHNLVMGNIDISVSIFLGILGRGVTDLYRKMDSTYQKYKCVDFIKVMMECVEIKKGNRTHLEGPVGKFVNRGLKEYGKRDVSELMEPSPFLFWVKNPHVSIDPDDGYESKTEKHDVADLKVYAEENFKDEKDYLHSLKVSLKAGEFESIDCNLQLSEVTGSGEVGTHLLNDEEYNKWLIDYKKVLKKIYDLTHDYIDFRGEGSWLFV